MSSTKLVRDKYIDIIKNRPMTKEQDIYNRFLLLENKVNEELKELADTDYTSVEEFADLYEVLDAMRKAKGISKKAIGDARKMKADLYGKFDEFVVLGK